jgi:hypothetical protein
VWRQVAAPPTAPSPTPGQPVPAAPSLAAPGLRSPVSGEVVAGLKPMLSVNNAAASGNVGPVTYQFELSEMDSFPGNSRTSTASNVTEGNGVTGWQPPSDLIAGRLHWHARQRHDHDRLVEDRTFKTP